MALVIACGGSSDSAPAPSPTHDAPLVATQPEQRGPYGVGYREDLASTRASTTTGEPRTLEISVWYPAGAPGPPGTRHVDAAPDASGAPYPVIVYSHGNTSIPFEATYYTEHLTSWGFVVIAPGHTGNTQGDCPGQDLCGGESTADSAPNRIDDVEFVLDQLIALGDADPLGADAQGRRIVDPERAGLTGHSFGGFTTIATLPRGRFDAGVAFSGFPYQALHERARDTRAPIMLMQEGAGGVLAGLDPAQHVSELGVLFQQYPGDVPHYGLVLPFAEHASFVDCDGCTPALPQGRGHELILRYATAFLLKYVAGDARFAGALSEPSTDELKTNYAGP